MSTPHTVFEQELESYLAGRPVSAAFQDYLAQDSAAREEVRLFQHQASLLRSLRVTEDEVWQEEVTPAPGFYARVMQQIETVEAQASPSIWTIFLQPFGQRLAFASLGLFLVLSGVLFMVDGPSDSQTTAQGATGSAMLADENVVPTVNAKHRITGNTEADRAAVLTQLVAVDQ